MDIVKLIIVFAVIVIAMRLNKPIHISVSIGAIATVLLYGINLLDILNSIKLGVLGKSTIWMYTFTDATGDSTYSPFGALI